MLDEFHRNINYLRISVTDRCNLRCVYCIPAEGVKLMKHTDILSLEEIAEIVKVGVRWGIDKVRITGGEPLVRRNVVELVRMISSIKEIKDVSMTTNGILLSQFAPMLKEAGLQRVNISLDTLNPETFRTITRGGNIDEVFKGIRAARESELFPIKINCVIKDSSNEPDAVAVAEFCEKEKLQVRFIHEMDLHGGFFSTVEGGEGGHCSTCNRLRLTANGYIKPCLFNDLEYSTREIGIDEAFRLAFQNKPECGSINLHNEFNNIGG